ncbi:MAG: homoserine dehydrogenase [Dehalococcoidia bacterium]|nr:homoserine dehydrogenase [Dehalococcoidia bacterium]
MGLGVVGGGVAATLLDPAQHVARTVGRPVSLKRVLVRQPDKERQMGVPPGILTADPTLLLNDPSIQVVVEVIGGEEPASSYIRQSLSRGKSVVTANKEVMAKEGQELLTLAAARGVDLLFEASVGGGIPIVGPLMKDLLANDIRSIQAIINGTTNYMLTRMARDGMDFDEALKEAQGLGFAEADPANDVEGIDAGYKLAVLASLAFHTQVRAEDVHREGISGLRARDFRYAHELGYAIKLLAIARREGGQVQARVHPCFVPQEHMLAKVDGVFNAVEVEGDLTGKILFHGRGAGREPTTSAIIGDLVEVAKKLGAGGGPAPFFPPGNSLTVAPMSELVTRYYIRLGAADRPGVLAQIARVLGDQDVSIASVIQKDSNPGSQTAELVVTTHPAREKAVQESLQRMRGLQVVRQVDNLVRVEDWPSD